MTKFAQLLTLIVLACASSYSAAQARFVISSDQTEVLDQRTGLIWRRCIVGAVINNSGSCSGSGPLIGATLFKHPEALTLAKQSGGWRIPNVKELWSIVDGGVDSTMFPDSAQLECWTSTPDRFGGDSVFVVNTNGGSYVYPRTLWACLRLVR